MNADPVELLVVSGRVRALDPYWFFVRDDSLPDDLASWSGVYEVRVDGPSVVGARYADIVRWQAHDQHDRARDDVTVFSIDGGSVALFDDEFFADLERAFDPTASGASMIARANAAIEARTGFASAIPILVGRARGRGELVGDGEYYFRRSALRSLRPAELRRGA